MRLLHIAVLLLLALQVQADPWPGGGIPGQDGANGESPPVEPTYFLAAMVGSPAETTLASGTFTLMNLSLTEVADNENDPTGYWTTNANEVCFAGTAPKYNASLKFAVSIEKSTGGGTSDAEFRFGFGLTGAIGNGDEEGPVYKRSIAGSGNTFGLGSLEMTRDIYNGTCIGLLGKDSGNSGLTLAGGNLTVEAR